MASLLSGVDEVKRDMAGDERQLVKWLHSKDPTGKTYLAGTIVPVKQSLPVQAGRPRTRS